MKNVLQISLLCIMLWKQYIIFLNLQNEWDELMLETFTLKTQLDGTRQELAQVTFKLETLLYKFNFASILHP